MLTKTNSPFEDIIKNLGEGVEGIEKKRKKWWDPEYSVWDLATALMVCHNVTPVYDENGVREF